MNYLDVLVETRKLLDDPSKHCKDYFAKDANGRDCSLSSHKAVCWCIFGAFYKVAEEHYYQSCLLAINKFGDIAYRIYDTKDIVYLNKVLRHDEILNILDIAIAESKQVEAEMVG